MRNLTVIRKKSFMSFSKVTVYIEDGINPDGRLGNLPCRKLGDLKNGEKKSFVISDDAVKIYVVKSGENIGLGNGFYTVTAGNEDVFLSGNLYGNRFIFDTDTDPEKVEYRNKTVHKNKLIRSYSLLFALFFGVYTVTVAGIYTVTHFPKTFKSNGMSMTLNQSFTEIKHDDYDICCQSKGVLVLGTITDEQYWFKTPQDYAEGILRQNGMLGKANINNKDGLVYFGFDYTDENTLEEYHYYGFVFEDNEHFWLIQFATKKESQSRYRDDIFDWAKSVKFEKEK